MVSISQKFGYYLLWMIKPSKNYILYDSPAIYQICVQGQIDPAWSDRLEGMAIHKTSNNTDSLVTTLEGELIDQAALAGVLNTLYEMHLPLLLVQRLNIV